MDEYTHALLVCARSLIDRTVKDELSKRSPVCCLRKLVQTRLDSFEDKVNSRIDCDATVQIRRLIDDCIGANVRTAETAADSAMTNEDTRRPGQDENKILYLPRICWSSTAC